MLQAIDADGASRIDFRPIAEIAVPAAWFEEKGVEFRLDADDLDQYRFAAFWLDGKPFALMSYVNGSTDSLSLLAGDTGSDETPVAAHVSAVADAFRLPPSLFSWRENGELVSFSRTGAASATA